MKLAFEEYGDNTSPVLIILHGFFASSRNWRQIARQLANQCHVYVVDMRNHGLSPHAPTMNYPTMADDLLSFFNQHGISKANILGHSMGGKVAMWFAINNPEKIHNLIVADISPVSYQHSFDNTMQALKQLPLDKVSNRKQADEFLSNSIQELSYRQFLLQNLQFKDGKYAWRINLEFFHLSAAAIVAFPGTEHLPPFADKALFLMGENSVYTDEKAIYAGFPNAEIIVLQGANHWLHVDKPAEFCAHVRKFVEKK